MNILALVIFAGLVAASITVANLKVPLVFNSDARCLKKFLKRSALSISYPDLKSPALVELINDSFDGKVCVECSFPAGDHFTEVAYETLYYNDGRLVIQVDAGIECDKLVAEFAFKQPIKSEPEGESMMLSFQAEYWKLQAKRTSAKIKRSYQLHSDGPTCGQNCSEEMLWAHEFLRNAQITSLEKEGGHSLDEVSAASYLKKKANAYLSDTEELKKRHHLMQLEKKLSEQDKQLEILSQYHKKLKDDQEQVKTRIEKAKYCHQRHYSLISRMGVFVTYSFMQALRVDNGNVQLLAQRTQTHGRYKALADLTRFTESRLHVKERDISRMMYYEAYHCEVLRLANWLKLAGQEAVFELDQFFFIIVSNDQHDNGVVKKALTEFNSLIQDLNAKVVSLITALLEKFNGQAQTAETVEFLKACADGITGEVPVKVYLAAKASLELA